MSGPSASEPAARTRPILVGYEPSEQGRDALALGVGLARASRAPLLLACVYAYEPPLYVGSDEYQAMLRSDADTALSLASADLPSDLPAGFETLAVSSPPPARGLKPAAALHDLAATRSAEVLVVGSCHRGGLGRVLVGSIVERLLHAAPCAIAVAAGGSRERASSLTAIGVAFDGRPESEAALELAACVARSTGATLRLISALEPLRWVHATLSPGYFTSWLDEGRKAMHALQAEVIDRISDGLVVDGVVREGGAADVLSTECEGELDLLVLGSRGYGPLGRVLLGGVSHRVARNAGCSVLIAPRPGKHTDDEHQVDGGSQAATDQAAAPPVDQTPAEQLGGLVRYSVLAPSSHNTQPWLFRLDDEALGLYADRTRALPVNDPDDRELTISCGAALLNLRIAAGRDARVLAVEPLPDADDPDLLARLQLDGQVQPASEDEALFEAIPARRTYRKTFQDLEIAQEVVDALQEAAETEGAWLHVVAGGQNRAALADLIAEGDRMLWGDRRWRRELGSWMHPRGKGDGLVISALAATVAPLVVTTFDMGKGEAAKDRELASGSPLMVVLGTEADSPADWLAAGQALERVLLRAAAEGVQASFLNQPIQVAELRPRLQGLVARAGFPQIVLRLGYPVEELEAAPRRPVEDVVERGYVRAPSARPPTI